MKKLSSVICAFLMLSSLIVGAADNKISFSSKWKIQASSDMGNTISKAFDGDSGTIWHSNFTAEGGKITGHDEPPHIIDVDFGAETTVSGWTYLPRNENFTGVIYKYNIYASDDGKKYNKIYSGEFDYGTNFSDIEEKSASWGDKKMRSIRIEIISSQGGYGSAAEINFLRGTKADGKNATGKENMSESGKKLVDRSGWSVKVNSDYGSTINKIIDNNTSSHWHSFYKAEGSNITEHDNPPYDLEVSFGKEETISGIIIYQRADSSTGRVLLADIYAKDAVSGEYYPIMSDVSFISKTGEQAVSFGINIKTDAIKLNITSTEDGYGSLAEFYAIAENETYKLYGLNDAFEAAGRNKNMRVGSETMSIAFTGESWGTNTPDKAVDGDNKTFWQTTAQNKFPVSFTVDLGEVHNAVTAVNYLPRGTSDFHGLWRKVSVYASEDGKAEKKVAADVEMAKNLDEKSIELNEHVRARYFRFEISEAEEERISVSEISFYETAESAEDANEKEFMKKKKLSLKIGEPIIEVKEGEKTEGVKIDAAPFIENGSTMIPLRGLFELMDASVVWDDADQSIRVEDGEVKMELQVESKLAYVEFPDYGLVKLTLSSAPRIVSGRTFIPLRFVSEKLGYNVLWDGETQEITIYK